MAASSSVGMGGRRRNRREACNDLSPRARVVQLTIELTPECFQRGAEVLLLIWHLGLFEPEAVQRLCGDRPPSHVKPSCLRLEHAGEQN